MPTGQAFTINIDSLTPFVDELTTQLSGIAQPAGILRELLECEVLLGEFAEARLLGRDHEGAARDLAVLLGQARDAIDFAREITKAVAAEYLRHDDGVVAALHNAGAGLIVGGQGT